MGQIKLISLLLTQFFSFALYQFTCPHCSTGYISNSERTLHEPFVEQTYNDKNAVIRMHFNAKV